LDVLGDGLCDFLDLDRDFWSAVTSKEETLKEEKRWTHASDLVGLGVDEGDEVDGHLGCWC